MRLMRRLFVVYTLAALLLACAVVAVQHAPALGSDTRSGGHNGAWIDHRWVGTRQNDAAITSLCALAQAHDIGTLYVHVGPTDAAGRIADGRAPYAGRFASTFHIRCPAVRILAWIGQLLPAWDGLLNVQSPAVRDGLVRTAARFVALGFDGVQYDIEPVPDGDPSFLDLLRRTRAALGEHTLAVAAPALLPPQGFPRLPHLHVPLTPWAGTYYARVAALTDELDVMLYVTALRSPAAYSRFVAEQTADLSALLPSAHIRIGMPVFLRRDALFDDRAENLSSALTGISQAFPTGVWPAALAGVALYPLWDMTPTQWNTFDSWLARKLRA